jgi:uncharacterized membrane protein
MPGMRRTDDRTFVAAFQSIDRAIINPAFMATFFGALVLTALAALLHLASDERSVVPLDPARFDEARWVRWNHVRALASTAACGLLAWALVESGQAF